MWFGMTIRVCVSELIDTKLVVELELETFLSVAFVEWLLGAG